MKELEWLEQWYEKTCDGDWEHIYGISIDTLDNPGWRVRIDLRETGYEHMSIDKVEQDHGENDWLVCRIENKIFEGSGDCRKLGEIIRIFQKCVENYQREGAISFRL
ncbi:MAG: rhodanese-related sulfurtransferase [Oscillospiraceae bacterium]|jgi:hypothetical protein|nr:rhodanese-related sulfurtransferase [Oscillospiraceae bacterium]